MSPRRKRAILVTVIASVVAPIVLGYGWWRYTFPYGLSHCCDMILYGALEDYARTHDGAFPAGETTPEASMSLLYREKTDWHADERLLRGKTVPEHVVKDILERGELLSQDTCGWHYVEGLRMDDDPRLALIWDTAGLGHMGGRLAEGGHIVIFVDGQKEYVPEVEWEEFIEKQHKLLADRRSAAEIRHDATICFDGEEVKVQVRVMDDDIVGFTWGGSTFSSNELIATLNKRELGIQGLPVIPSEEIKNAKVIVEPEKSRVRFVLQGRDLIFDQSGFHCEATTTGPLKE